MSKLSSITYARVERTWTELGDARQDAENMHHVAA